MRFLLVAVLVLSTPAYALTPEATEFIEVMKKLEPVQCQKQKLRREMALAQAEQRPADAKELRAQFAKLNRDPETARLEKRLAALEKRISRSDAQDMEAISFQQRSAFYRCE